MQCDQNTNKQGATEHLRARKAACMKRSLRYAMFRSTFVVREYQRGCGPRSLAIPRELSQCGAHHQNAQDETKLIDVARVIATNSVVQNEDETRDAASIPTNSVAQD